MTKKKVVLADSDRLYQECLSDYFMQKAPQLELNIFSDIDLLKAYINETDIDILIVDEKFADEDLSAKENIKLKIVLSAGEICPQGFVSVAKYQKTENLLNEILLKYAEATGSNEVVCGNSCTKTAVFYSPSGGSGKTVLSLGMAVCCARAGINTFYLNLEDIDSVKGLFENGHGSMSDVLLAVKTKGINAGIKLAQAVAKEPHSGLFYIAGPESISEYCETSSSEMASLINTIKEKSEYDVLIIDLSSSFNEKTVKILSEANVIFTPVIPTESATAKLSRFLDEAMLHDSYTRIFEKLRIVQNRTSSLHAGGMNFGAGRLGSGLQQTYGPLSKTSTVACIGEMSVFLRKADILKSGDMLFPVFRPLIELLNENK